MIKKIKWVLIVYAFVNIALAEPKTAYDYCFKVGDHTFSTEIALTDQQRKKGMMMRKSINSNQAMLFVFPSPTQAAFWMKNTLIPLDILYFNEKMILQQIVDNALPCKTNTCETYPSNTDNIQYVLEIKAGEALKQKIIIGDQLSMCQRNG